MDRRTAVFQPGVDGQAHGQLDPIGTNVRATEMTGITVGALGKSVKLHHLTGHYPLIESPDLTSNLNKSNDPTGGKLAKDLLGKITFELGKEEQNGDKATVEAKITSLDIGKIAASAMKDMIAMAFATAFSNDPEKDKKAQGSRVSSEAHASHGGESRTGSWKIGPRDGKYMRVGCLTEARPPRT